MNVSETYMLYSKYRDAQSLKDGQIAAACDIGRSTFSDWKYGRSIPKLDKLNKICSYLGISVGTLMGVTDDPVSQFTKEDQEFISNYMKLGPEQKEALRGFLSTIVSDT